MAYHGHFQSLGLARTKVIPCNRNVRTAGAVSMAANCRRQMFCSTTNHTFRLLNMTASRRPMLVLSDEPRELNPRGFCGINS